MADATLCARVIIAELIRHGVTDLVLAPGSRSAPLAYEAFEADRIGLLRLHVRHRRADGRLPGARPGQGLRDPGGGADHLGNAPRRTCFPAVLEACTRAPATRADHRQPAAGAGQHRRQPDHRPGPALRPARPRRTRHLSDQTADPPGLAVRDWPGCSPRPPAPAPGNPVRCSSTWSSATRWCRRGSTSRPPMPDLLHRSGWSRPPTTELSAGPQTVIIAGDAPPARRAGGRRAGGTRAGCRCWRSRRATPGPGQPRWAPPGCWPGPAWPRRSSGSSSSGTRRCPGRSAACWPATTWSWSWSRRTRTGSTPGWRASVVTTPSVRRSPTRPAGWPAGGRPTPSCVSKLEALLAGQPVIQRADAGRRGCGLRWAGGTCCSSVRPAPIRDLDLAPDHGRPAGRLRQPWARRDRRQHLHRRRRSRWPPSSRPTHCWVT